LNIKFVFLALLVIAVLTFLVYWWFMGFTTATLLPACIAAVVMMIAGFLFAAVSGYLVGLIGSSNNPISGLTLSTLMVAAILMVCLGATGTEGVTVVLAVAGVICVSAAVAGEMLQDLKVGHILGGTPWKMQIGNIVAVVFSALLMWFPLVVLQQGDIKKAADDAQIMIQQEEETRALALTQEEKDSIIEKAKQEAGFGGKNLGAPQAGLMANLSKGIVEGNMVWPLVIIGIIMALAFIALGLKSPMLVCVGMYLSFGTIAAIFVGGIIRWILDLCIEKRKYNDNQKTRIGNCGVLLASGLIAGEALMGLLFAALAFFDLSIPKVITHPAYWVSVIVFIILGIVMVRLPLTEAGDPNEAAAGAVM